MSNHKVLIIKTGYSEFLDNGDESRKVSLGDVLRTTPLLHVYKNKKQKTDIENFTKFFKIKSNNQMIGKNKYLMKYFYIFWLKYQLLTLFVFQVEKALV